MSNRGRNRRRGGTAKGPPTTLAPRHQALQRALQATLERLRSASEAAQLEACATELEQHLDDLVDETIRAYDRGQGDLVERFMRVEKLVFDAFDALQQGRVPRAVAALERALQRL